MPGCWIREDHDWEWRSSEAPPPEVDRAEPAVVAMLLGPDGEPLSTLLAREPIGYRQRYH